MGKLTTTDDLPARMRIALGPAIAIPKLRDPFRAPRDAGAARQDPVPRLVDTYGTFRTRSCGFTAINVPNGQAAPAAGHAAWFEISSFLAKQEGQELQLAGVLCEQLATDPGAGAGFQPWGATNGLQAAVVVGQGLPCRAGGGWSNGPCGVPGVLATGPGLISTFQDPQYIWSETFPAGSFTDAIPLKRTVGAVWLPVCVPLGMNDRVQVALVVRTAANASGADRTLRGLVHVQLTLAETIKSKVLKR